MASNILIEFDLSGAEWVVVAYLSGDENMLGVVASGKSPHVVTGSLITSVPEELVIKEHKIVGGHTDQTTIRKLREQHLPELLELEELDAIFLPRVMSIRQAGKKSNHGLNYNMKYRRFALENEIPEVEALPMVEAYTKIAYPGIPKWHEATREQLRHNNRTLENCFGRKVRLMGEWGQDLFDQAYSFVPQSTVVDVCNKAMCLMYEDESPCFQPVRLGAQVHDSVMVQYPIPTDQVGWLELTRMCRKVGVEYMRPDLEYGGRKFKLGCDMKIGLNWGDMRPVALKWDLTELENNLRSVVSELTVEAAVSSGGDQPQRLASPDPTRPETWGEQHLN